MQLGDLVLFQSKKTGIVEKRLDILLHLQRRLSDLDEVVVEIIHLLSTSFQDTSRLSQGRDDCAI